MLRFKNSYDGSEKTSGHFGFYREVFTNGLHVVQAEIAFSIKQSKNNADLIMPKLNLLFERFLNNEYYEITRKFREMEEIELIDTKAFIKEILEKTKLFQYECSDKNDYPSKKSRELLGMITEAGQDYHAMPTLWDGYNAFNRMLHNTLKMNFS